MRRWPFVEWSQSTEMLYSLQNTWCIGSASVRVWQHHLDKPCLELLNSKTPRNHLLSLVYIVTGFANEYFRQQCVVAFHNLHIYLYVTFFFRHDLLLSLQPCSRRTFKRIKPSNAEAKKKIITSTRTQRNNMVHLALCSWIATVKFCDPQICGLSCTEVK